MTFMYPDVTYDAYNEFRTAASYFTKVEEDKDKSAIVSATTSLPQNLGGVPLASTPTDILFLQLIPDVSTESTTQNPKNYLSNY